MVKIGTGVITGAPLDDARPTGVAVDPVSERLYVNDRDHIAVFDLAGAPLGQIGDRRPDRQLRAGRFPAQQTPLGVHLRPRRRDQHVKVFAPTLGGIDPGR